MIRMSIAYGGIIAFLFRGVNLVVALATVLLTARVLSRDDYGLFGLALSVVGWSRPLTSRWSGSTSSCILIASSRRPPSA